MGRNSCKTVPPVSWHPITDETNLSRFQEFVEKKYNIKLDDYWNFHEWSVENFPEFWECVWQFFGIIHSTPYTEVFDKSRGFQNAQWFSGAKLNYAENVFRYRDSHVALITANEEGHYQELTYSQLYDEVANYAAALRSFGVRLGDKIASVMSNRKEAVIAFLAAASMGAIWSAANPDIGPKAIIRRLSLINPKMLFTVDRYTSGGKEVNLLGKLPEIIQALPSLQKVVIVRTKTPSREESIAIEKGCWLSDFLKVPKEGVDSTLRFEQLPLQHPLIISYTSGTTGAPKMLIHSSGGILSILRDYGLHMNCTRSDRALSISPGGWVSWNMFTTLLHLGLTLCLFEGSPYYLSPTYFWDLVEKFQITYGFLPASVAEDFQKEGCLPRSTEQLKTLRCLTLSCSPVKAKLYDFVSQSVKPGLFFSSMYGSSELMSFYSGANQRLPVYRGEIQCLALGVDGKCIDENGHYVVGKRGNMVIGKPLPSLPVNVRDDKLADSYLQNYPGHWDQKDDGWINPVTRGFIVYGRSDEKMNPNGEVFSSSEIYEAVENITEILDSVCVSQISSNMNERAILFVKLSSGCNFTSQLEEKIRKKIEQELTELHVPELIVETPEIPFNMSGKKMELMVKKLINKQPVVNKEVVINQSSLDFYENFGKSHSY